MTKTEEEILKLMEELAMRIYKGIGTIKEVDYFVGRINKIRAENTDEKK